MRMCVEEKIKGRWNSELHSSVKSDSGNITTSCEMSENNWLVTVSDNFWGIISKDTLMRREGALYKLQWCVLSFYILLKMTSNNGGRFNKVLRCASGFIPAAYMAKNPHIYSFISMYLPKDLDLLTKTCWGQKAEFIFYLFPPQSCSCICYSASKSPV